MSDNATKGVIGTVGLGVLLIGARIGLRMMRTTSHVPEEDASFGEPMPAVTMGRYVATIQDDIHTLPRPAGVTMTSGLAPMVVHVTVDAAGKVVDMRGDGGMAPGVAMAMHRLTFAGGEGTFDMVWAEAPR